MSDARQLIGFSTPPRRGYDPPRFCRSLYCQICPLRLNVPSVGNLRLQVALGTLHDREKYKVVDVDVSEFAGSRERRSRDEQTFCTERPDGQQLMSIRRLGVRNGRCTAGIADVLLLPRCDEVRRHVVQVDAVHADKPIAWNSWTDYLLCEAHSTNSGHGEAVPLVTRFHAQCLVGGDNKMRRSLGAYGRNT